MSVLLNKRSWNFAILLYGDGMKYKVFQIIRHIYRSRDQFVKNHIKMFDLQNS